MSKKKFAPPPGLRRPDLTDIDFTQLAEKVSSTIKKDDVVRLKLALSKIGHIPAVPYSSNRLTHATRTIEEMVRIALEALNAHPAGS